MKWFWWIGGTVLYFLFKEHDYDGVGPRSWGNFFFLLAILTIFGTLGFLAQNKEDRIDQEKRDQEANELAKELIKTENTLESDKIEKEFLELHNDIKKKSDEIITKIKDGSSDCKEK